MVDSNDDFDSDEDEVEPAFFNSPELLLGLIIHGNEGLLRLALYRAVEYLMAGEEEELTVPAILDLISANLIYGTDTWTSPDDRKISSLLLTDSKFEDIVKHARDELGMRNTDKKEEED